MAVLQNSGHNKQLDSAMNSLFLESTNVMDSGRQPDLGHQYGWQTNNHSISKTRAIPLLKKGVLKAATDI